ncbi:hypothetical protein [Actinomyces israelii]|nr:hypothetical protein [Actinomyces israelii]
MAIRGRRLVWPRPSEGREQLGRWGGRSESAQGPAVRCGRYHQILETG